MVRDLDDTIDVEVNETLEANNVNLTHDDLMLDANDVFEAENFKLIQ